MTGSMTITTKWSSQVLFKDWRKCDQSLIEMPLEKTKIYYIHAKAWHLKGYLGGTHSWTTFWSNEFNKWLVVELSDYETLWVQKASIYYNRSMALNITDRAPCISDRPYNAKWFGGVPIIVGSYETNCSYETMKKICQDYPEYGFDLINKNCNTFTSYLMYKLDTDIKKPFRSIGYRKKEIWKQYGISI